MIVTLTTDFGVSSLYVAAMKGASPLTRRQRELIDGHPQRAARLLRDAGLDDAEWIEAVQDHHERSGGGGYPLVAQLRLKLEPKNIDDLAHGSPIRGHPVSPKNRRR